MLVTTRIATQPPDLKLVFGPLTEAEDETIRQMLREIDERLADLARHFAHAGTRGLELETWTEAGEPRHAYIHGYVTASPTGGEPLVEFCFALHPDNPAPETGKRSWTIDADFWSDCEHREYHRHAHMVHEIPAIQVWEPMEAMRTLRAVFEEVDRLGRETPLETWIQMSSDPPDEEQVGSL